jgi:phosphoribosylamine--glycine ligase
MRVLLIGNGGREHALAAQIVRSPQVTHLYAAPGNGGTATLDKTENVSIPATKLDALRDFAQANQIDLTVVGPEAPLVAGIVDLFQAAGLRIFGPSQAAAQLEGSKAFAKQFMLRHGIPTGHAEIFSDYDEAIRYLRFLDSPPVIKASGLAAGKGVLVPLTVEEAALALRTVLLERRFGEAGDTVLLEEQLSGPELSVLAVCDGQTALVLPPAQDYKRLRNGDLGPNTGGMGAFTPSPLATPEVLAQVESEILQPTLAGMAAEGVPYYGVLYAGLMLTAAGPKVIEFNARFGDPETQAILPLLESDLIDLLLASIEGVLASIQLRWRNQAAVTVVMAAHGYPDNYVTGHEITHIDRAEALGCLVFLAGAKLYNGRLHTAGGRVLNVTGLGDTVAAAAKNAYAGVRAIHFNQAHYRTDIGK